MSAAPLAKIRSARLEEIMPRLGLPAEAAAAVRPDHDAPAALAALEEREFLVEATKLMAHALPRREAVWWACMCANHTTPKNLGELDRKAVEAAESWVRQQTDEVRRAAFDLAQRANFGTPEAWAAVGAFWSGDSMSPLGQPPVPPTPHIAAAAVAGAVALSSVRDYPERRLNRLRRFLASGREIASGAVGRLPHEEEA
jgi:hypothetical protein